MMNPYHKLKFYLEREKYKKGQFAGDAPALERSKSHVRVIDRGTYMAVHMHRTDLIAAFPDGRVVLSIGGWNTPTTKACMSEVSRKFLPYGVYICTHYENKFANLAVRIGRNPLVPWRDGLTLDTNGLIVSELGTFKRYEADRVARKEFVARGKAFREALPLLMTAGVHKQAYVSFGHPDQMTFDGAQWPAIVSRFYNRDGPKETWAAIYKWACASLVNIVEVAP